MNRRDLLALGAAALACGNKMDFPYGGLAFGGTRPDEVPPPNLLTVFGSRLKLWHDPADSTKYAIVGAGYDTLQNKGGDPAFDCTLTMTTDARRPKQFYLRGNHYGSLHDSVQQHRMNGNITGTISQPYTILQVSQQIGLGTMTKTARSGNGVVLQTTGSAWPKNIVFTAGTTLTATGAITEDELALIGAVANGASSQIRKNGTLLQSGNAGTGAWLTSMFRGSSTTPNNFDQAHLGDFAIIDGTLSDLEWDAVRNYARWKYNIGIGQVVHWCPLGDSITRGTGSTDVCGWRRIISDAYSRRMIGGNKWVVSTGSVRNFAFVDDRASGVGGQTIAGAATLADLLFGVGNGFNCPVVGLMIGTNDAATGGASTAAYDALVRQIDSDVFAALGVRPRIMVTTIIDCEPSHGGGNTRANINTFNAALPAIWSQQANDGLLIDTWDARAALGDYNAANYSDQIHPNDSGYALLAAAQLTRLDATMALVA